MAAEVRPKFPHATGYEVGVILKLCGRFQRDHRAALRKAPQVERLPADDLGEDAGNRLPIKWRENREPVQTFAEAGDQRVFVNVGRMNRTLQLGQSGALVALNHRIERAEMLQPHRDGSVCGIRDGIARPREQIRQPDGRAKLRGENSDREKKRARNRGEQRSIQGWHTHRPPPIGTSAMRSAAEFPRPSCVAVSSHSTRFPSGASFASFRQSSSWRVAISSSATGSRLA